MTDKVDELIREIASRHGVSVDRNDPIMILQTINERLIKDGSEAQEAMLNSFKEELELIAHKWSEEAKDKAERTIKAALIESKKTIISSLAEDGKSTTQEIKRNLEMITKEMHKQVAKEYSKISIIILGAALIALMSSVISLWVFLAS